MADFADDFASSASPPAQRDDPAAQREILKDLATRIIPRGLKDELRALVDAGKIDPLFVPADQPLQAAVSQMFRAPDTLDWLSVLFAREPEKLFAAKCPCYEFSSGRFSTDPNYDRYRYRYSAPPVETPALPSVLALQGRAQLPKIAALNDGLLAASTVDSNGFETPLLHAILFRDSVVVDALDKLEAATGDADFLLIRNARGETMFHRLASANSWKEDQGRLDAASWMLQKRPELANLPDRFGWTPLDRLLSNAGGQYDSSMGRLLVAAGAQLSRQLPPKFDLATELAARGGTRLGKPEAKKPPGLAPAK